MDNQQEMTCEACTFPKDECVCLTHNWPQKQISFSNGSSIAYFETPEDVIRCLPLELVPSGMDA